MSKVLNSMPKNPVLGKGDVWTKKKRELVLGKNVLFGFSDTPDPVIGFVYKVDTYCAEVFVYDENRWGQWIGCPNQIHKIYDTPFPKLPKRNRK